MPKKALIGLVMLLLTSCSMMASGSIDVPTAIPTPASANQSSDSQEALLGGKQVDDLSVWLYSKPDPESRANKELKVYITDSNQLPVSDAQISFDIDMTNMSHGKNIVEAESLGEGYYAGTAHFQMPGPWRAIVNINRAGTTSTIRFDFNVSFK